MPWSTSNHEVIPDQEFLLPDSTMHPYLWAFLKSDGAIFKESEGDYKDVRDNLLIAINKFSGRPIKGQKPKTDVSSSRLRTWKQLFERSGFLTVGSDNILRTSPFGKAVATLFEDLSLRLGGANNHLTKLAISILNRYPLRNPLEATTTLKDYPNDADIFPYRAIWETMKSLDNKIHWQEMNYCIMHLFYNAEIKGTIKAIREARLNGGDDYGSNPKEWLEGEPAVEENDQTRRRITPWLSRAGFGGLLIEESTEDGWWQIRQGKEDFIDEALNESINVPESALSDGDAFFVWLTKSHTTNSSFKREGHDKSLIEKSLDLVDRYKRKRIICFSGIPATGKSRLARIVCEQLVDGDPYRFIEVQFHESTSYEDFVEGFTPNIDGNGFKLTDKTLKKIVSRARSDPQGRNYVLLIEEFSRANIHAVLGELLTYVEHRNRRFTLALSQEEIFIPDNLIILATMNPRDKSALQLDDAIIRRLCKVDVPPSPQALRQMLDSYDNTSELEQLANWYNEHYPLLPFGHGVFADSQNKEDIISAWETTAVPMLEDAIGVINEEYNEAYQSFPWQS